MRSIIFFDIDGTLATEDERSLIPESTRNAIAETRRKGNLTFVNSGRTTFNIPPRIKELGFDLDFRDFSKFSELQNRGIVEALVFNGFTKNDFTDWVIKKNIDTAQNVRHLPAILKDRAAREEFLSTNVTKALTKLAQPTASLDLSNIDFIELAKALRTKLDRLELKDARQLWSDEGQEKRAILLGVVDSIEDVLKGTTDEEE